MRSKGADKEYAEITSYLRDSDCNVIEDGCELEKYKDRYIVKDGVLHQLWSLSRQVKENSWSSQRCTEGRFLSKSMKKLHTYCFRECFQE